MLCYEQPTPSKSVPLAWGWHVERGGKGYKTAGHIGGSKVSGKLYLEVLQGLLCVLLHPLNFTLHVHQLPLSQLTFLLHCQAYEIAC